MPFHSEVETLLLRSPRTSRWIGRITFACLLIAARPAMASEPGSGLVVEYVQPATMAASVGFQPGDILLGWTFRPRNLIEGPSQAGTLDTPFDLASLYIEKAPRGELIFVGRRQGQAFSWMFRSGGLIHGLFTRPVRDLPDSPGLACKADPASSPRRAAWYCLRYAWLAVSAGDLETSDRASRVASEILLRASDPSARAEVLRDWAGQLGALRKTDRARELLEEALALERQREGAGLAVSYTLGYLAYHSVVQGDFQAAERFWLQSLEILEKLVPEGREVVLALDYLGYLVLWRGDSDKAQEYLNRAEAIQRSISTNSLRYAAILTKLALVAQYFGDLERAEALQRQALALNEQLVPGSQDHGGSLMNLAMTLFLRGELAPAEDLLRQSAELIDTPGSIAHDTGGPHFNLGLLALYRGDLAVAQSYFELALGRLQNDPDSIDLAAVYMEVARLARRQQRFTEACTWEKKALEVYERMALGGLGKAARLEALARIAREDGEDLTTVEALLRQADAAAYEAVPESSLAHTIRRDLGRLLVQKGRLAEAEDLFRQILSTLERRGLVGTKEEAEIHNLLGTAQRQRGKLSAAAESLCRATQVLDVQRSRLGGSLESRSWFESETQSYFFDCLSALVEKGRHTDAFHALERGKTRVFLELLGERDLRLAGLPPELKAERERLDVEYDRILSRLSGAGLESASEIAKLRARREEIKALREELIARLRLQAPQLAALHAPVPLTLAEARRSLDPGTTLLAYAVGPEESYLFVVTPKDEGGRGLEVRRLPLGKPALEKEIEIYRRLLTDPQSDLETLNAQAARLYNLLLRPSEAKLVRARRILISADGPLHLLPWAALRRRGQYLAQWRPIHLIASATVYADMRRSRRSAGDPGRWRLVAFGDPRYLTVSGAPGEGFADSEVRSALRRGLNLEPLPATRDEIREIAELFPGAEVYLGEETTEERAKQASPRADILHFASHALVDERFPLDSALALTLPKQLEEGRDNGLLQAWEIFESMRLDAHLVTLSACDTALGREMGGEGLLGLTRAFQFAGARSVLSSLWSVSDESTAKLMTRFYTYLRQGRTKDEALGAAQLDLIRSTEVGLSHPYHWAGFALYGDWR